MSTETTTEYRVKLGEKRWVESYYGKDRGMMLGPNKFETGGGFADIERARECADLVGGKVMEFTQSIVSINEVPDTPDLAPDEDHVPGYVADEADSPGDISVPIAGGDFVKTMCTSCGLPLPDEFHKSCDKCGLYCYCPQCFAIAHTEHVPAEPNTADREREI